MSCSADRRACATGRRCWPPAPPSPPRSWCATSSAASPTWTRTAAGCWRSSTPRLRLLHPLAEALEEPRERRILLHLDAQVTHAGIVEGLAVAVVERELTRAENLQRFLERMRAAALARAHLAGAAASAAPAGRRCARSGRAHGAAHRHLRHRLG